jgi:hypothetical protein
VLKTLPPLVEDERFKVFDVAGSDRFASIAPCSARAPDGTHRHKFTIPGVLFIMLVGKTVARDIDAGALNSSGGSFMWLCPWTRDSLFEGMGALVMDALRARRV